MGGEGVYLRTAAEGKILKLAAKKVTKPAGAGKGSAPGEEWTEGSADQPFSSFKYFSL